MPLRWYFALALLLAAAAVQPEEQHKEAPTPLEHAEPIASARELWLKLDAEWKILTAVHRTMVHNGPELEPGDNTP